MRIVVAMSGGVDSSVAAALLRDEGHDVVGLSMQLYDQGEQADGRPAFGSCCTIDDLHDARRVATVLEIPHYIVNFERQFNEHVVAPFVEDYVSARTPIPCVRCNSQLKFSHLLERAQGFDAAAVATGHYARVEKTQDGRYALKRGRDTEKDQSYFLFMLSQTQLASASFPLGELSKHEVRRYATERKLPVADKPDSHEICFVPDNDYAAFVERRAPDAMRPGPITDNDGHVLGQHDGVHRFTVGQRKGLGISGPIPLYVVGMDARSHTVTVGPRAALYRTTLSASDVNWIAGYPPSGPCAVQAQIRHRHEASPARLSPHGPDAATVVFDEPQPAISPGQAVVFYDGDEVVGGGWIDGNRDS
jgi:tRNA-specific 2-thiouridylase